MNENCMTISMPQLNVVSKDFDWKMYKMRLEQFFQSMKAHEDADKKKCILLSLCTNETLKILCGLCDPKQPNEKTYVELTSVLNDHFTPPVIIFHERKNFYSAEKDEEESVTEYLLRIRTLAATCNFGARLEGNLTDRFIIGMKGKIYERLCEDNEWTIEKALEIARKYELRAAAGTESINYVKKNSGVFSNKNGNKHRGPMRNKSSEILPACNHCGFTNHSSDKCKYKNITCNRCNQVGHMASICKKQAKPSSSSSKSIKAINVNDNGKCEYEYSNDSSDGESYVSKIYSISSCKDEEKDDPIFINLKVFNKRLKFQVDTGSPVSVIPGGIFDRWFRDLDISVKKESIVPKGYGGHRLNVRGSVFSRIDHNDLSYDFKFLIIENGDVPIIGRDFLRKFNQKVSINTLLTGYDSLDDILEKYSVLFDNKIGKLKDVKVHLDIQENVKPKFVKARRVPYAFRKDIEQQLSDLVENKIITKVEATEWGTPLVPVLKSDGHIRICADYKVTINPYLKDTNYPLPRIQDLLTKLGDGKIFSKIDLVSAYNQLELDDSSKKLVVWSTHMGNFCMNRLPFGVKPATGIFQREIEKVLGDITGVISFLDDIIISAKDLESHNQKLNLVFNRLKSAGLRLNRKKCIFAANKISYLGHILSRDGIYKMSENEKVVDFPIPKTITEVRSFCGFENFYGKFIENLSTKMYPIYNLLKNGENKIIWNEECDFAFKLIKAELISEKVLSHFNPKLPLVVTCDASDVGIGAVLAHKLPDGNQRPIEFASRVLSAAEKKYGTIEKEALAIIFATKKFYQYLIGHYFVLVTDHKPLLAIFGENRGIPQMSANRLQRWAFQLSAFNYKIQHVKSSDNCADLLSRLPSTAEREHYESLNYLNFVTNNSDFPIQYQEVLTETESDEVLSMVIKAVKSGEFKLLTDDKYKPYVVRRNELTIEGEILMWGFKVVIPMALRQKLLRQIHTTHMGIVKTKSILRSYVWWPGIDSDIERLIKSCEACLSVLQSPAKVSVMSWSNPEGPWERVHI